MPLKTNVKMAVILKFKLSFFSGKWLGRQHHSRYRPIWPGLPSRCYGPLGRGYGLGGQLRISWHGELEVCLPEVHGLLDIGCPLSYLICQSNHHGHFATVGCSWAERKPEKVWGKSFSGLENIRLFCKPLKIWKWVFFPSNIEKLFRNVNFMSICAVNW